MLTRLRFALPPALVKTLRSQSIRAMGIGSHVSDNDPERIAKAQAQAAEGHVPSRVPTAPHWSEVLASDSEAIVKSEVNAKQLSAAEASDRASKGLPVPPGGVVPEPGAAVGDDIAALRQHTIKILAEEAFVDRIVYVPSPQEGGTGGGAAGGGGGGGGGEKGGKREEAKDK